MATCRLCGCGDEYFTPNCMCQCHKPVVWRIDTTSNDQCNKSKTKPEGLNARLTSKGQGNSMTSTLFKIGASVLLGFAIWLLTNGYTLLQNNLGDLYGWASSVFGLVFLVVTYWMMEKGWIETAKKALGKQ